MTFFFNTKINDYSEVRFNREAIIFSSLKEEEGNE